MSLTKIVQDPDGLKSMKFTDGGKKQSASYTWYRGSNCNFGPTGDHLGNWAGYSKYFVGETKGNVGSIDHKTRITAFGSCFAANISSWLARRKYRVLTRDERSKAYVVRSGEGFVNSYAILQQFEWAFHAKEPTVELWHGYDASAYGYNEDARRETLELFNSTDLFILTFGLSEVWYDKPTGEVFWRAIPQNKFDEGRHGFRTVSPDENYQNIKKTLEIILENRPGAKVIMTLSPIPLVATFRPLPCPVSNSFSKASLKCALDRVLSENIGDGRVFYWPSYEIVLDGFRDTYEPDLRHIRKPILAFVMKLFEQHWCKGGVSDLEMSKALYNAKLVDGTISRGLKRRLRDSTPESRPALFETLLAEGKVPPRLLETIRTAYGCAPTGGVHGLPENEAEDWPLES